MNTYSQKISLSSMGKVLFTVGEIATSTADKGVVANRALSASGTVSLAGANLSTGNSHQK